jgi:glycosyltransferase involved in cell wall biosynthesis
VKILVMADVLQAMNSGAAGTEYQTIRALERLGHKVDALWGESFPHKVRHGNLHYLLELPSAYRKAMQDSLAAKRYDVVHVNQPHGYLAAKALFRSGSGSVFIHRSHGFEMRVDEDLKPWREKYDHDGRPLLKKLASRIVARGLSHSCRSIARYADGHIASASQCGEFLHEQMEVPIDRIAVIPQAAADSFLEQPAPTMNSQRLRRILYVGQFAFFKAPMLVAAAINELSNADGRLEFTWVCSSKDHEKVRAMLVPGARDRVRLLDWITQEELMRVYDSHGVFLFPSFFEGFGKVFLEAMSRGLCVIAADNGGAHDVITHCVDGLLTPTGDVGAMTKSCLRLISNSEEAGSIAGAAAETARAYNWDRVARETVAFYEDRIEAKLGQISR